MDPATLTDQITKRQLLLRNRALDRGTQLCIENMNAENFNKMVYLPHMQRQIEVIKQREPKILDSDANFIFRVLKERTLIAMEHLQYFLLSTHMKMQMKYHPGLWQFVRRDKVHGA